MTTERWDSVFERLPRANVQPTVWMLIMSEVEILLNAVFSKWLWFLFPQPHPVQRDLRGTTTIVTGCSKGGMGYEIAKDFYRRGSHVVLACRSMDRGGLAKLGIIRDTTATMTTVACLDKDEGAEGGGWGEEESHRLEIALLDCSSLSSVRSFANLWLQSHQHQRSVDFLFLNAGIIHLPDGVKRFTEEGHELIYTTNFLGHFLLSALLSSAFSPTARVIQTSSCGATLASFSPLLETRVKRGKGDSQLERGFNVPIRSILDPQTPFSAYVQSKAMQIAFAYILQKRFDQNESRSKCSVAFHPGLVASNLFHNHNHTTRGLLAYLVSVFAISPNTGAQTALWLALADDGVAWGGIYTRHRLLAFPWHRHFTPQLSNQLWKRWNADAGLQDCDWHF